jgi:hypothetical protein
MAMKIRIAMGRMGCMNPAKALNKKEKAQIYSRVI